MDTIARTTALGMTSLVLIAACGAGDTEAAPAIDAPTITTLADSPLDGRANERDTADARRELAAARAQWDDADVGDHEVVVLEFGQEIVSFHVVDGEPAEVRNEAGIDWIVPAQWTVPARFDEFERLIAAAEASDVDLSSDNSCSGVYFAAQVDPTLGHLVELSTLDPCSDGVVWQVEIRQLDEG